MKNISLSDNNKKVLLANIKENKTYNDFLRYSSEEDFKKYLDEI